MQFDYNNTAAATAASPNSWNDNAITNNNTKDNTYDNKISSKKSISAVATVKKTASAAPEKSKRKQVKNACVNCQKACKKCDDGRPCKRCVKLGLTATCRDSDRKERKKGVKRGPYKKRQAYIKDKPVYPKLTEEHWKQPIYESVPQVLSQNGNQSIYNDFYDDSTYCVPSQSSNNNMSLSPISSSSFVDESDETLHYAYGYGYTNSTTTIATTITHSPPPAAMNMLDHQYQTSSASISGNVTPTCYSWDDNYIEGSYNSSSSGSSSPIDCTPIINNDSNNNIVQFQPFPTTTDIIYQTQQQKELSSIIIQQPIFDLNQMVSSHPQESSPISPITADSSSYWYNNNDMPIEYNQPLITAPIVPLEQQQHYFEYSIPSQQQQQPYSSWTF